MGNRSVTWCSNMYFVSGRTNLFILLHGGKTKMTQPWVLDTISRSVMWERPLHISELQAGIRGTLSSNSERFSKDLPNVPTDEYLSKIIFFLHGLVALHSILSCGRGAPTFRWDQVICAPCWLVHHFSGGRQCVLSLLEVIFYMKIILSDGCL